MKLYEALLEIILESSEEEINELIREDGKDPDEVFKEGKEVIRKALERSKKE